MRHLSLTPFSGLAALSLTLTLATAPACSDDGTGSESDGASTTQGSSGTAATDPTEATGTTDPTGTTVTGTGTTATGTGTTATTDPTATASSTASSTGETTSTTSTTATTGTEGPSFTDIYEQIIMPQGCNAGYCHGGGAGGLTMTDEATSYANLVEVEATTAICNATLRVAPGAPDESILWYRARPMSLDGGMPPCAPKMPQGSTGLSEADGQLLLDWIAAGALD